NQLILRTPNASFKRSSISARLSVGLRLGLSKQDDVVSKVPRPSVSTEPPSSTQSCRSKVAEGKARCSNNLRVIWLSNSEANLLPQPLNVKSNNFMPAPVSTVSGPWSRAQVSLLCTGYK